MTLCGEGIRTKKKMINEKENETIALMELFLQTLHTTRRQENTSTTQSNSMLNKSGGASSLFLKVCSSDLFSRSQTGRREASDATKALTKPEYTPLRGQFDGIVVCEY